MPPYVYRLWPWGTLSLVPQAKRILARFDRFEEIVLDFEGIDFIGQAFADEIFRVFPAMNPHISLLIINATQDVLAMVEFAKKTLPTGPIDVPPAS